MRRTFVTSRPKRIDFHKAISSTFPALYLHRSDFTNFSFRLPYFVTTTCMHIFFHESPDSRQHFSVRENTSVIHFFIYVLRDFYDSRIRRRTSARITASIKKKKKTYFAVIAKRKSFRFEQTRFQHWLLLNA